MARLHRFEDHRFVGTRDDMIFYDCDDPEQFEQLSARAAESGLLGGKLLQSFAPDTDAEARNRGFQQR